MKVRNFFFSQKATPRNAFQKSMIFVTVGLLLFSTVRFLLWFNYPQVFQELSWQQTIFGFLHGLRFDFASMIVLCGVPLLLACLPASFVQNRLWVGLWNLWICLILILYFWILFGDLIYFGFVKRHVTNELLFLKNDITYLLKEALGYWDFLLLGLLLNAILLWQWWKISHQMIRPLRCSWKTWSLWFGLFILLIILGRGGIGLKPLVIIHAYSYGSSSLGHLTLNGVFSIFHSSWQGSGLQRQNFSQKEIQNHLNLSQNFWNEPFPLKKQFKKSSPLAKNLVVIMVESLTPRYLHSYHKQKNNLKLTPNFDEIAAQSWKFNHFYAYGQRSTEGLQAILTGVPILLGGITVLDMVSNYSRLAKLAEANGYDSIFVNTTQRQAFLGDAFAGAVGFSEYYGLEDMPLLLDYPPEEQQRHLGWDYEALIFALEKIKQRKKPFFLFINANTDHTPYPRLPKRFERYPPHPNKESGYLNTLIYTDWAIGKFFQKAKQEPWFPETMFVITADHVIAHFQGENDFPEKFRIPLLFYAPKILPPKTVTTLGSQLDLPVTFIDILGLQGSYTSVGKSLLKHSEARKVFVKSGNLVGIITEQGYLKHSLAQRLETKDFTSGKNPPNFEQLENQLLSWDYLIYNLLQKNRWSP